MKKYLWTSPAAVVIGALRVKKYFPFLKGFVFQAANGKSQKLFLFEKCVNIWSGRVVGWCWVNFQCCSVLLIWIIVGQGPTLLTVGAGGLFSVSLGDAPIKTEILSQRAVKPKTTNCTHIHVT